MASAPYLPQSAFLKLYLLGLFLLVDGGPISMSSKMGRWSDPTVGAVVQVTLVDQRALAMEMSGAEGEPSGAMRVGLRLKKFHPLLARNSSTASPTSSLSLSVSQLPCPLTSPRMKEWSSVGQQLMWGLVSRASSWAALPGGR